MNSPIGPSSWSLRHAYDNVDHYRTGFDRAGIAPDDLTDLDSLAAFPFLTKADLRDNYPFEMFAVPRDRIARIHSSSGTTGKPTVVGYTAGEAIGPEIFDFYRSLGINLKQLYGQTEACVFVTQQPDGEVHPDTVGVPCPGVEIRIDDSGEVLYRSPGAFREYYKNPEATADTKDAQGWVSTGDAGFFDSSSGHLRIIDRAKDVGRLANGHLFAPKFTENKLKFYPDILETVVFGRDRTFCTAFINIDLTAVGNWAERNNIAYASYQELAAHPKVYGSIQSHIEAVNRSVAEDERLFDCQVHRFLVLHKELDADDGEITRTGKVRRRTVEQKYATLIEAMHDGSDQVYIETEITYEDGRKGAIRATLEIRDARVEPRADAAAREPAADAARAPAHA